MKQNSKQKQKPKMANSRAVNLSTVALTSKDSLGQKSKSESDSSGEEEYITGLEGYGKIGSLATLMDGLELSGSKSKSKTKTTTSSTSTAPPSTTSIIGSISSSSIAERVRHSTPTFPWLEKVLELFYIDGSVKTSPDAGNEEIHKMFNCEGEDPDNAKLSAAATAASDDRKVTLIDFEISPFDQPTMVNDERIPMLSKMMTLKTKYQVKGNIGINYEMFVVKLPPEDPCERELAKRANAHHREICFYNRILPFLQDWSNQQGVHFQFGVPVCIYGKQRRAFDAKPIPLNDISTSESILILEDVRVDDFGKRHFVEGLSIDEAKAAIAEICKIHVASWAFHQQVGFEDMLRSPAHKPPEVAKLYEKLVQQGLQQLKTYLQREMPKKTQYVPILQKLRSLELRIQPLLIELMQLPKHPGPICLIHMDFWCDNVLFRQGDNPPESEPEPSSHALVNEIGDSANELDSEAWRPKPFIPESPSTLQLDEAYKASSSSSSPEPSTSRSASANAAAASSSSDSGQALPKYLEYLTDPTYACVDLKDVAYRTVQDSMNNTEKKLFIKDANLECRIIDWQFFSYGCPTHDLAILILTSLTPEVRRKNTEMLLNYYLQVFDSFTELYKLRAPFDASCLRKQFKRSKLLAFLLVMANMEIVLADESTTERFVEVVKDLIQDNVI